MFVIVCVCVSKVISFVSIPHSHDSGSVIALIFEEFNIITKE